MRTGIRCGVVSVEVIHLSGPTKAGTLCGRKPRRWGFLPRASLADALALADGRGARLCSRCRLSYVKGG